MNVRNGEELKQTYRELCKKNHPDKGGKTATMQAINLEYEKLKKQFANTNFHTHKQTASIKAKKHTIASEFGEQMRKAQAEIKRKKEVQYV